MTPRPWQPRALLGLGAAVLLCLPAAPAHAGETSSFASLLTPTTPEQTAWGGAMAAGGLGPDALRSNPASLARNTSFFLAASHRSWQHGMQQEWAGGRVQAGSTWLGVDVSALHAGELEGYDEQGIPTGSFQPIEIGAGAGAAVRITSSLTLGVAAHGLFLDSSGSSLRGWSGDLGAQFSVDAHDFGLAVRHLGPSVAGELGSYPLPTEIAVGGLHPLPSGFEVSWTASLGRAGRRQAHGGFRWRPSQALALLAGGRWSNEERPLRPSAGVEFDLSGLRLAYGFVPDEELGATHQISLAVRRPLRATPSALRGETQAAPVPQPVERAVPAAQRPEQTAPVSQRAEPAAPRPQDLERATPAPQRAEPAAPATRTSEVRPVRTDPGARPPATWSVWGGRHRSAASAEAEVRAWRAEKVHTGEAVQQPDGSYRVRLRAGLARAEAERLARTLGAHALPDAP